MVQLCDDLGNWQAVCDYQWECSQSAVACRQLGYDGGMTVLILLQKNLNNALHKNLVIASRLWCTCPAHKFLQIKRLAVVALSKWFILYSVTLAERVFKCLG